MAAADGNVDEDELEALRSIADHLGLAEDAVDLAQVDREGTRG